MYRIGQEEIDAVAAVIKSGKLFRYGPGTECERFEKRYSKYLRVPHVRMTSSGTHALTAALVGLGIGPGDEVIVPAHTYMATAVAVLAVGAIPVIVDIDESITLDPQALDDAIGPCTRAVIPVHMWGLSCDMDAIMAIARKRKLLVVEDACQAVGGGYEGRKCGSIGHAGAFSFNYFKNMTAGEGGAVVAHDPKVAQRMFCAIDSCSFYWTGRKQDIVPFTFNGSRASVFEGAILNVQLDRLPDMITQMRKQKKQILRATKRSGLTPAKANSLNYEASTHNMFLLPSAELAQQFAAEVGCGIAGRTGRHTYTEWDPILNLQAGHHPALNPFNLPQNRKCRKKYSKEMCPRSLAILGRTAMVGNHPDRTAEQVTQLIAKINAAAAKVLAGSSAGQANPVTPTKPAAPARKRTSRRLLQRVSS